MAYVGAGIGRMKVTSAVVTPSEAGYIRYMRGQTNELGNVLNRALETIKNVTPEAILEGLKPIRDKSLSYVPVRTGALKRSYFEEVSKTAGGTRVLIGYARYGQPWYAALVHERLDFRHRAPTRAKFLEAAIQEEVGRFKTRVAYAIQYKAGLGGNLYG